MKTSLPFPACVCLLLLQGFSLSSVFEAAVAGSGMEIASRHSVTIGEASRVVIGNGSLGCSIDSAEESGSFLEATLIGEHWLLREQIPDATPLPAIRIPLCRLSLRLRSDRDPGVEELRLARGAVYRLDDNALTISPPLAGGIAAATLTVSPTRNLVFGRFDFQVGCDATLEIKIPLEGEDTDSRPRLRSYRISPGIAALARELPFGESYGLGAILKGGGTVDSATRADGMILSLRGCERLTFALLLVHPQDGRSLKEQTDARIHDVANRSWEDLFEEGRNWWRKFWERSILDLSESSDERARGIERLWIGLRHGIATHGRGTFPPGDSGYWPSAAGGRVWHPFIWETFRGWILSGNEADIGWLSYPLFFNQEEDLVDSEESATPLLPLESGPDGVGSCDTEVLTNRFLDLFPASDKRLDATSGRRFSAYPLLVDCLGDLGSGRERTDGLFSFLRANALRAEEALEKAGQDPSLLRTHLLAAIDVAREQAQRIGVDGRSQARWRSLLESHGFEETGNAALRSRLSGSFGTESGTNDLDSLLELSLTSDGLARDSQGNPSVLLTGLALGRLADSLFSEREGTLELLPELPMDGSWSVDARDVSVPEGFTLRMLAMRKGVVDSFLIRSNSGGLCRVRVPAGWSSAKILNLGNPQSPVEMVGEGVVSFETEAGEEFLIGPVW